MWENQMVPRKLRWERYGVSAGNCSFCAIIYIYIYLQTCFQMMGVPDSNR